MIIRSTARRTLTSQGFTLIELMIALVLGLLIIGATVTVFLSNQQTSRTMTELGNAQEAFRFASQTIMRVVQQGSEMEDPEGALLRVVVAPGEGKMDCLGRSVESDVLDPDADSIINTFSISDGELLCSVAVEDIDGNKIGTETEAVLVEGLDIGRSEFTFGIADVADGYWKSNSLWGEVNEGEWNKVRSVRVRLAKQVGGETIGATAVFSATMRCPVLGC